MLTRGDVRKNPLSLPSKGEKVGREKMLPSMPKRENIENSCQLMSKEFSNNKRITNKHDDRVDDKGKIQKVSSGR